MKFTFKEEADVLRAALHGLATRLSEKGEDELARRAFDVLVATIIVDDDDSRRSSASPDEVLDEVSDCLAEIDLPDDVDGGCFLKPSEALHLRRAQEAIWGEGA